MPEVSAPRQGAPIAAALGSLAGVSLGRDLKPLRAVFGQDEANHGAARYPVDGCGLVWVPLEAVDPLTARGGFAVLKAAGEPPSVGTLRVHHDDAAGCSFAGERYFPDRNGDVLVPAAAAGELSAHGFVPVLEKPTAALGRARAVRNKRFAKG